MRHMQDVNGNHSLRIHSHFYLVCVFVIDDYFLTFVCKTLGHLRIIKMCVRVFCALLSTGCHHRS